jgi:CheY-like chemotaxis protein
VSTATGSPAVQPRTFRILAVSEQRAEREFLARVLRRPDYEIVAAADGQEALQLIETNGPFDLLLTDLEIPGIDGPELARRFRANDPAIKILYLTREADRLFEERTALWEEEAFLEKPLTAQGVLEAVALILIGHIPPMRPPRVHVPGSVVRFENQVAELVRFSVTGALTRASEPLEAGSMWRITLELPSETLHLDVRVVSCERLAPAPRDAALPPRPFAIALAFVEPSSHDARALQRVIREVSQAKPGRPAPLSGPLER